MDQHICITGLGGSGKTTLAKKIAEKYDYQYVSTDDIKFAPGWKRRTLDECMTLLHEIKSKADKPIVFEGVIVFSNGDQDRVTIKLMLHIFNMCNTILILTVGKTERISRMFNRSIEREISNREDPETCDHPESPENRARMMITTIENNDLNEKILEYTKCIIQAFLPETYYLVGDSDAVFEEFSKTQEFLMAE